MTDVHSEELGGTNAGAVRLGDTVRRTVGAWTPTVHAVLRHLEERGFSAPRARGFDDLGREVLTWVEGVASWERHRELWGDDERLRSAALLLRELHSALDAFAAPPDAQWRSGWGRDGTGDGPLCHYDFAPWNVLVSPNGSLTVIDWDGVGPGDRLAELAYAAASFVPLRRNAECRRIGWAQPPDRVGRLETFWRAYGRGEETRLTFARALVECAQDGVRFGEQMHREGREPFASWWATDDGQSDRDDVLVTESVVATWLERPG